MTLSDGKSFSLEGQQLCAEARAEDAQLNETERMRIANYISNPLSGRDIQTPI